MFCSKCGFQSNPGERFCRQCGAELENNNQQIQQSNQFIQSQQNINSNQQSDSTFIQNNNNSIYRLTLIRPKEFIGSFVKFKIFIDDNEVGTIKNGETVVLNVISGNHTISFNKTMNQNINITSDTFADVAVVASGQFGLINIRDNNGLNTQNNELYTVNAEKIISSAKNPLILSSIFIALTIIMLFTIKMVINPCMYGISIGYTLINLSSLKKNKQIVNDKYESLITLNVISIIISIVGSIISTYLMIW